MTQYNTSTQQVKVYDALSNVSEVAPNLWVVNRCVDSKTFEWMFNIYNELGNEFVVTRPDKRLLLKENCNDYQRLRQIGVDQVEGLSKITGMNLSFMDVKFWLDMPSFGCQVHGDSKDIVTTYQVYIHTVGDPKMPCHGAEFLHVDPSVEIPFTPNTGYINLNTDSKPHKVYGGNGIRISIAFQYNLAQESP
jgi:hypothetical protein